MVKTIVVQAGFGQRAELEKPDTLRQHEGLPEEAIFRGYVIYNPLTHDYLCRVEEAGGMVRRAYAGRAEQAKAFSTLDEEVRQAFVITRRTVVGCLFAVGDRLVVALTEQV